VFELMAEWNNAGLRCLIIGAHALSFYGVTRETADIDLLISREDRSAWDAQLIRAGYKLFHGGENFAQFTPPATGAWPLDLMLVREETFTKMFAEARAVVIRSKSFLVPSLDHLLALKLHALKHTHPRRTIKDFQDVLELIHSNPENLAIESQRIRLMFERYGTNEWYEKVRAACES
jgi:predicted nucleotidyltransferase